jgi:hypothetical protein
MFESYVFGRPTLLARLLIKIDGIAMGENRGTYFMGRGLRGIRGGRDRLGAAE